MSPSSRSTGRRPAPSRRARPVARPPRGRRSGVFVLLFAIVAFLVLLGLVMVLSASSVTSLSSDGSIWSVFLRQAQWVVLGGIALVVALRVDYRAWQGLALPIHWLATALLVLVLVPGVGHTVNGSTRWLVFGPVTFQPSELAKLGLVLACADLLARERRRPGDLHLTVRPALVLLGTTAFLVMLEPDLGTTILAGCIVVSILYVSGTPMIPLALVGVVGSAAAVVLTFSADYRRARVLGVLDPWSDPLDTGYQTLQGLSSVANGGLTGIGVGASRGKWGFLPFAHTDFIYAVISEELGLVGATSVVVLFAGIGVLGYLICTRAADEFGRLVAAGITTWIVLQAFVNIGGVLGVVPITGVPLPFISAGGSSLVLMLFATGILLNIARQMR